MDCQADAAGSEFLATGDIGLQVGNDSEASTTVSTVVRDNDDR